MKTKRSFSADHIGLSFYNTPRELFEVIETIQAKSRWTGPFGFSYEYREDEPPGEPPLSVSIPLAHRVLSCSEYENLAREVVMEFEGWGLHPLCRFPTAVRAGIYDPPCAPGAKLDPDACLMIVI